MQAGGNQIRAQQSRPQSPTIMNATSFTKESLGQSVSKDNSLREQVQNMYPNQVPLTCPTCHRNLVCGNCLYCNTRCNTF